MKPNNYLAKIFLAASLIGAPSMALADDLRLSAETETVIQSEKTELAKAEVVDPPLTAGDVLRMSDEVQKNYVFTQLNVLMSNLRSPVDPHTGEPKPQDVFEAHKQYYADLWDAFYNPDKSMDDGNVFSGLLTAFKLAGSNQQAVEVFQDFIGKILDLYAERRAQASSAPQPNSP